MDETLSREEILALEDREGEWVTVPEWKGRRFYVAPMDGESRNIWDRDMLSLRGGSLALNGENIDARLVALTVVDPETKERLFTLEDVEALGKKNSRALKRLADVGARLSGLDTEAISQLTELLSKVRGSSSGAVSPSR